MPALRKGDERPNGLVIVRGDPRIGGRRALALPHLIIRGSPELAGLPDFGFDTI